MSENEFRALHRLPASVIERIAERRARVLALREAGLTLDQIAARLGISDVTVRKDLRPLTVRSRKAERKRRLVDQMDRANGTAPKRMPGDAPCYCMHCSRWNQQEPLRVCTDCQAEYAELSKTMPRGASLKDAQPPAPAIQVLRVQPGSIARLRP